MHHRSHDQPGGVSASRECLPPGVGSASEEGLPPGEGQGEFCLGWGLPPGRPASGGLSPGVGVCPTGTRIAGSTHPTGMFSCLFLQIIVMV